MSRPDEFDLDPISDLLADRVLQGLDADEAAELAKWVGNPEDAVLRLGLAAAEANLALEPDHFDPLPMSVLERVERDADDFLARSTLRTPRRSVAARVAPWLGWASAAALLISDGTPTSRVEPTVPIEKRLAGIKAVKLSSTDHPLARNAAGAVVWSGERQEGYLALDGLAEVEAGRGVYQLWIFDATRDDRYPVDGGTFTINDAGRTTLVPIHPPLKVGRPTLFAITLEPPGGVVVSDRKRILLTASP